MKIVEPTYKIIEDELQELSYEKRIEKCGRLCYKSEDKITDISAPNFVKAVRDRGHNSVLEMATVTLKLSNLHTYELNSFFDLDNTFINFDIIDSRTILITGSLRAFREHFLHNFGELNTLSFTLTSWLNEHYNVFFEDLEVPPRRITSNIKVREVSQKEKDNLEKDLRDKHKYVAVRMITNRAVTHEIVRHRVCSFLQESQRYCRYSNDKFGNEITFIKPCFYDKNDSEFKDWKYVMRVAEEAYFKLLETSSPQAARTVIPNSCKTEIIIYTNLKEWKHIFKLRDARDADPSMQEIMKPIHEEFKDKYRIK